MPKKKGTPGGNPDPVRTKEFEQHIKPKASGFEDVEMGRSPLCVKLPLEFDALIRPLPNRSDWMRRVLIEAAKKELLKE